MKQFVLLSSLIFFLLFPFIHAFAGPGDTIRVQSHNSVRMNWYGNFDRPAQFPAASVTYRKALLHLTLGCGGQACSSWDYTTQIFLQKPTGVWDSTETPAPNFTVNGGIMDTACYNQNPRMVYFFDTVSNSTDSVPASPWLIRGFNHPSNLFLATDSISVYPGDYWNYLYDSTGAIDDSIWVGSDSCLFLTYDTLYTPFPVHDQYEIARYITPYGSALATNWNFTWTYDITDFAPLLHDSVGIRSFYSGWSDGFNITLDFELIEGTPPREVVEIHPLWNGDFPYGNASNSIENYLVPRTISLDSTSVAAKVRIATTGHGFGGNQNCAEFCRKTHNVLIGSGTLTQDLWRSDCDFNPLYPQNGTWVYDRANWCPGSEVRVHEFEGTPYYTPGTPLTVDYNMASYTYSGGGSQPIYTVRSYLFGYKDLGQNLDAEVYDLRSPTDADVWSRINPTCNKPEIIIRNTGHTNLTSLTLNYGVEGGAMSNYSWTGNLSPMQTATVLVPAPSWGSLNASGNKFIVILSAPNGGVDQYALNDTLRSTFNSTPAYPNYIYLNWKTNNRGTETTYKLFDSNGNAIYQSSPFIGANMIMRDSFNLSPGCYKLQFTDAGQDGLTWSYNSSQGTGYASLKTSANGTTLVSFNPNFGGGFSHFFSVDTPLETALEIQALEFAELYPNPGNGDFFLNYQLNSKTEISVSIFNLSGSLLETHFVNSQSGTEVKLQGLPSGVYLAKISSGNFLKVQKIIIVN